MEELDKKIGLVYQWKIERLRPCTVYNHSTGKRVSSHFDIDNLST